MLEVSNLKFAFKPANGKDGHPYTVFDGLSFSVIQNDFLCILGPSGCGKTTLLRVIIGLLEKQAGTIKIADQEKYLPGKDVCMVFQSYGLFPWQTVMRNVEFGLKMLGVSEDERREKANHFIGIAGLRGFENHYPHQISGGMQQRVGLARALACNPKLLLMDEPFAAVDFQTRERLQDELLRICEQTSSTVVFVTHSIEEAVYLGTRVIVLSQAPSRVHDDITIDLGSGRWDRNIRIERAYEDYVISARRALQQSSDPQND